VVKQNELYRGKAKTIFATADPNQVVVHFRDDVTAFNRLKSGTITNKGAFNNQFNAVLMQMLEAKEIKTHFIKQLSQDESLMTRLEIIPIEWVIRNSAAGSLCKRYGLPEGMGFEHPIIECYYKNDELGDPLLNDEHIIAFDFCSDDELHQIKNLCRHINTILVPFFAQHHLILVDYKLEFGRTLDREILLADEITPDGCRIWDIDTKEKLDKDRFRFDLGDLMTGYVAIAERLHIPIALGKA
jgi:phosphoribosylaminoimidazole-succinocarboxamide synthase